MQIPGQAWDDGATIERWERAEVFAQQKPPPSPDDVSTVILDLIQDLPEFTSAASFGLDPGSA